MGRTMDMRQTMNGRLLGTRSKMKTRAGLVASTTPSNSPWMISQLACVPLCCTLGGLRSNPLPIIRGARWGGLSGLPSGSPFTRSETLARVIGPTVPSSAFEFAQAHVFEWMAEHPTMPGFKQKNSIGKPRGSPATYVACRPDDQSPHSELRLHG